MRKRIFSLVFCILLLLSTALSAFAAETGSITVWFRHGSKPVAGASFELYKAAEWNGSGHSLAAPFADYSVKLSDDPASEDWKTVAFTLSAYAARDGISPLVAGETDETGIVRFDGLSDGLYLLVGDFVESGDMRLFPQPMLVSVPFVQEDSASDYDVMTEPKYDAQKITDETVTRRALKIWKDGGNESKRPAKITVQMLCDGEIYDEQELTTANNWRYTWENLDADHNWQLTEKEVPEDYTVQITRQDITFTVTNTNDNPPPPDEPNEPNEPTLPQTGLLWWPVPVLAGIGVATLFFGIYLLLRKKEEPHE